MDTSKQFLVCSVFSKEYWYGFSGAECWETPNVPHEEKEPLVIDGNVETWFAIVDSNGIELHIVDKNNSDEMSVFYTGNAFETQKDAVEVFSVISVNVKPETLVKIFHMEQY